MNKKENILLAEIGTDVKWLKRVREEDAIWLQKSLDRIIVHQEKQNGKITKNRVMIIGLISFLTGAGILEGTNIINLVG